MSGIAGSRWSPDPVECHRGRDQIRVSQRQGSNFGERRRDSLSTGTRRPDSISNILVGIAATPVHAQASFLVLTIVFSHFDEVLCMARTTFSRRRDGPRRGHRFRLASLKQMNECTYAAQTVVRSPSRCSGRLRERGSTRPGVRFDTVTESQFGGPESGSHSRASDRS